MSELSEYIEAGWKLGRTEPKIKKFKNSAEYLEYRRLRGKESALNKIKILENSKIDFTKFGWVNKAANLLKIPSQKIHKLIKLNDPNFFNRLNCFQRTSSRGVIG